MAPVFMTTSMSLVSGKPLQSSWVGLVVFLSTVAGCLAGPWVAPLLAWFAGYCQDEGCRTVERKDIMTVTRQKTAVPMASFARDVGARSISKRRAKVWKGYEGGDSYGES